MKVKDGGIKDSTKNKYYLYVGRIAKEKGVELFCKAISELGYKAIIVGDGSEKRELEEKYPQIEFTGWKDKEEVIKYMEGAKALIFPSIAYETAGLTIVEAQTIGIPCIVNSVCAGTEFVDKNSGYIFTDVEDLKEKIKKIDNKKSIDVKSDYEYNYSKKIIEYYKAI